MKMAIFKPLRKLGLMSAETSDRQQLLIFRQSVDTGVQDGWGMTKKSQGPPAPYWR